MRRYSTKIKDEAILLRRKGFTFRQISSTLKLPLGTSHLWTKHIKLSARQISSIQKQHRQSLLKGQQYSLAKRKQQSIIKNQQLDKQSQYFLKTITKRDLHLLGLALYWGEGFKKDSRLGFANSDPAMIKLVLKWLYDIGHVPKNGIRLRVGLNASYKQQTHIIEQKWSDITNIPLSQFQKPFFQKVKWQKKYPNPDDYMGVLRVRANKQREFFLTIKSLLRTLQTNLLQEPLS